MKLLLILLGLILASVGAFSPGLRVKFNVGLRPGKDFFFDIPRTKSDAILQSWVLTQRPHGPLPALVLYCPSDLHTCAYFDDDTGIISGLQIALPQNEFTDAPFDWKTQGYTEWAPHTSGDLIKYWTIQQFFVSAEHLEKSPAERMADRDESIFLQENAIWLTGFNGKLDRLSNRREDIENSIYTKQACIPWMGRHFYYNMSSTTPCQADTMYPWFPLVHSGSLVGTGYVVVGKMDIKTGQRDWFERPPRLAVQTIVPSGPKCLYELAGSPGVLTMHIYYIAKPWSIGCLFQ